MRKMFLLIALIAVLVALTSQVSAQEETPEPNSTCTLVRDGEVTEVEDNDTDGDLTCTNGSWLPTGAEAVGGGGTTVLLDPLTWCGGGR